MSLTEMKYSRFELERYFDRIRLPSAQRVFDVSALNTDQQLQHLTLLTTYQLTAVPFENLTLHYSWHRVIRTDVRHLHDKIVGQPGRGGYCMENNSLFHAVLNSIGFDVYMAGSRVYSGGFTGLTHCVNIVTIGPERYTVDVGFGSNMPHRPCKMESGLVQSHILPGQMRLRYGFLPGTTREAGRVWYYEHRQRPEDEWAIMYCVVDGEILPQDVEAMNLLPSTSPKSIFLKSVMCVRFTTGGEVDSKGDLKELDSPVAPLSVAVEQAEIDGVLVLFNNTLKWRRNGEKKIDRIFEDETERVDALRKYFGIHLDLKDRDAIKGTTREISTTPS